VEAELAQLLAKFFALVVLIKLEKGIEGGRWHAINRLCQPIKDCGRFQIPLVVRMLDIFLSAPLGPPLEYLIPKFQNTKSDVPPVLPVARSAAAP
jgi:hypothetical protein